jgi:hypothetical protein
MSDEFSSIPTILFKTLKNTELGAESVHRDEDGSVVVTGVLKKVTESMIQSYPRIRLGKWTHNRLYIRYTAEDAKGRDWKRHDNGEALDLEAVLAL